MKDGILMNDSALFGNTISLVVLISLKKVQKSVFDKFGFGASWVSICSIVIQYLSLSVRFKG